MTKTITGHRGASAAVLIVGGGAVAAASWIGGDHVLAVGLVVFYAVAATVAWLWSGGAGDVAAIMRVGGDERQRLIDRDATAVSGLTMAGVALVGAIVQLSVGGDPGPYGIICAVGGLSYAVAVAVLRHRR